MTDFLTVLTTRHEAILATKTFTATPEGVVKKDYSNASTFTHKQLPVSDVYSLHSALQSLASDKHSFVIRGAVIDPAQPVIKRRKHARDNEPAYITEAAHHWLHIDVDGAPLPTGYDVEAVKTNTGELLKAAVWQYLPDYLHDATFSYQLSSSMLVNTHDELRVHLWFWLEQPLSDGQLDNWAKRVKSRSDVCAIDGSVYRTVQPNYTAAPVFVGMVDPCDGFRSGLVEGSHNTALIPEHELADVTPQRTPSRSNYVDPNDVIAQFSNTGLAAFDDLLRQHGYTPAGEAANCYLYVSPLSKSGSAGVKLFYNLKAEGEVVVFGANDHLPQNVRCDYFEAFAWLEHNGDKKAAYRAAAERLGVWQSRAEGKTQPTQTFTKWQRQCYAIAKKAQLEPQQFDHVVETNERYLSQQTIDRAVEVAGGRAVFIVESPVGSGKTTSLLARYANESSLLTLSPLQALCAQLSADSNSLNYLQPAGHERDKYDPTHLIGDAPAGYEPRPAEFWRDYHVSTSHRLVCTPHSLSKLAQSKHGQHSNGLIYRHKHVIVDESDSCLNVLSDNSVGNEQSIYEALRGAMFGALSQGGSVWLSSAHHHDSELAMVEGVLDEYEQAEGERLPIVLIKNHHKPNTGRTYEVIKPRGNTKNPRRALRAGLLERVSERLTEGACVALASDSDVFAREAYKQLSEQFDRVLLVDAQNKGGHEQQQFIATRDPSQWQAIVYSPVLTSGFSVAAGHGFEVFGYSSARSVSPKGFEQLLGRFRDVDHYTLALEQYREGRSTDVEAIKRELAESDALDSDLLKQTIDGRLTWRDEGFVDLHARNISHDRWLRSNWRTHLLALLEATGRQSVDAVEVEVSEQATERYNHTREAVELAEAEAIATAQRLEPTDVERIEAKSAPTREQLLAVERYKYESFYGVEATPERLLEDKRGRERAIVQRLVLARASDEMLRYLTEHDAKRAQFSDGVATARASVKRKRYAVKRLLYRAVLAGAAVDVDRLHALADYHTEADSVTKFTDTLKKHHTAFRHEATLPKRSDLKQHATRVLGRQLRELGFATEGKQRRNNDGEQVRHYVAMLDLNAYPHLAERVAEREAVLNRQLEQWQGKQPNNKQTGLSDLPTYEQPYCHTTSHLYIDLKAGVCDSTLHRPSRTNGTFENTFFNTTKSPAAKPPKSTKTLPFDLRVAFSRALNRGHLDHLKAGHRAKLRDWLNQGNTHMLLKAYEAAPESERERIRRA